MKVSTVLALSVLGTTSAATLAAEPDELEQVLVTGSRIQRTELESAVPVQVLNADFLANRGTQNLADVLQQLPAFGTSTYTRANSNFATSGNGVSTLNLRNAGDPRTLVLINGHRTAAGISGTSIVDINNLPTDLIKDVEVITGGASAVYGSEAIAGVVNFVLNDDFQGLAFHGQGGVTSHGDNGRHLASISAGADFLQRGHAVFNVQWDKDEGLHSHDRALSANDNPFRSSYAAQGRFDVPDGNTWTYNPDNTLKQGFNSNIDGYNRNGQRLISVPVERVLLTGLADFALSDTTGLYADGSYASVKSHSRIEALATDGSDARLPDGTISDGLSIENPFIPAAIRSDMLAAGATTLGFRKRLVGAFDRSNRNERSHYRLITGLKGALQGDWRWDAYVSQSGSRDDTTAGTALRDRYYYALDAIAGPNNTVICRDATARAAGCAPFNPFGFNSVSKEAAAYITDKGFLDRYSASIRQQVAAANFTGSLFALPAGSVKLATGVEHRRESSSEQHSPETQAGMTMGNALSNTGGNYHVTEAYVEAIAPVLADHRLARSLDVEAAWRYGDYSTVGGVSSWKAGLNWAPAQDLRIRAVYSQATRAPNINELYQGRNQDFPTGLTDPCNGVTAATTGAVAAYCRALPGAAQNMAAHGGAFFYDANTDLQSIESFDGGNAALKAETARTWTLGLVLTPTALPGLSLTIDWYDIRIRDAIAKVPLQYLIDQCVNSAGVSPLCTFIVREGAAPLRPRTPGTIWQVNTGPVNAASIVSSGIDIGLRHKIAFESGHQFRAALNYTYVDTLRIQPLADLSAESNLGQLNGPGRLGAGFRHRANLQLGYTAGAFDAGWTLRYQSAMADTLGILRTDDPGNFVPAYGYHDLQGRYSFGRDEHYSVYIGVQNLFDRKPPLMDQNRASNITGTETAADSYDVYGRFIHAGFRVKL